MRTADVPRGRYRSGATVIRGYSSEGWTTKNAYGFTISGTRG